VYAYTLPEVFLVNCRINDFIIFVDQLRDKTMRNLRILTVTIVSMLTLGGCASPNNGYGQNNQARLPVGAVLGAVAGGVLGGQGNGKVASAAIGAAVGGYAGNEIQNQQEANPNRY
jgi:uncharacterized membrane protein